MSIRSIHGLGNRPRQRKSLRGATQTAATLVKAFGLLLALAPPIPTRAQGLSAVTDDRILYLGARAALEGAPALPHRLTETIERTLSATLGRAGSELHKLQRSELAACPPADYRCLLAHSSQGGRALLDIKVQKNDEYSYYVTVVFVDRRNPDEATSESLSHVADEGSGPPPLIEDKLAAVLADKVAARLQRWQQGPGDAEASKRPPGSHGKVKLAVTVVGPGRVDSEPPELRCGSACESEYPATTPPPRVTLLARPLGANSLLYWSAPGCLPSWPCSLLLTTDTRVTARFGRSLARKALTGVFGGLGLAGAIVAGTLFGMAGSDAGSCSVGGITVTGCIRNTAPLGGMVLGLATLFGTGSVLGWWLPGAGH